MQQSDTIKQKWNEYNSFRKNERCIFKEHKKTNCSYASNQHRNKPANLSCFLLDNTNIIYCYSIISLLHIKITIIPKAIALSIASRSAKNANVFNINAFLYRNTYNPTLQNNINVHHVVIRETGSKIRCNTSQIINVCVILFNIILFCNHSHHYKFSFSFFNE